MVGSFPTPYLDEIFYSIYARYASSTGYSALHVKQELFGIGHSTSVEFPSRLVFFTQQVPWQEVYNVEIIIQLYTLLPLYTPFISEIRLKKIKELMLGENGRLIHTLIGLAAPQQKQLTQFRYCPICYLEDHDKYRESYWHRIHQARNNLVCPIHNVFLEDSLPNEVGKRYFQFRLFDANSYIKPKLPRPLGKSAMDEQLLWISGDITWLLNSTAGAWGPEKIRRGYRSILKEQGLLCQEGRIRNCGILNDAFLTFYSDELFQLLGVTKPVTPHKWFIKCLSNSRRTFQPIQHILIMRFFGISAVEFYQWISGNNTQPLDNQNGEKAYIRIIRSYTSSVDSSRMETIRLLWPDPTVSINEIGRRLNIPHKKVSQLATQMKLRSPRDSHFPYKQIHKPSGSQNPPSEGLKQEKRTEWLQIRKANPNFSITQLKRTYEPLHSWLQRHDREWLQENKPIVINKYGIRKLHAGVGRKVNDWDLVDREVAQLIPEVAKTIIEQPGRPVKATKAEIGMRIGKLALISRNMSRMPLTNQALLESIESRDAYDLRRVSWGVEHYGMADKKPSWAALFKRLKLKGAIDNPRLMEAFDKAMEELTKKEISMNEKKWQDVG